MRAGVAVQHLGGRDQQHDSLLSEPGLHVVADGNGVLGDCSARAIEQFRHHLHEALALEVPAAAAIASPGFAGARSNADALRRSIEKALRWADEDLCAYLRGEVATAIDGWRDNARAAEAVEMLGREFFETELSSGTTLVAFVGDSHVVHVGDSRAYRVAPARGELVVLTRDHGWDPDPDTVEVDGTIYKHGLAMARVLGHPLLRAHGVTAEPDIMPVSLAAGELLLLCSDGLRPFLERDGGTAQLCELLARPLADAATAILDEASRIATDNVSLILIG